MESSTTGANDPFNLMQLPQRTDKLADIADLGGEFHMRRAAF